MKDRLMCFTPWDVQSKRQYSIEGVYPALNAGQGIGGQAHGVCYAIQGNLVDRNVGMNGIGVSDEGVSYTLNEVDRHAVCYGIDSHPMDSRIRLQEPDEPVQTLSRKMYKGTADVPMVLIDKKSDCADTVKSPPPRPRFPEHRTRMVDGIECVRNGPNTMRRRFDESEPYRGGT